MKCKYKLLIIGCFAISFFPLALIGYMGIYTKIKLSEMESRRKLLLYETNPQSILVACRELSNNVINGQLNYGIYLPFDKNDKKQIPQLILNLHPVRVDIEKSGIINIMMSPDVMYGVLALPENYYKKNDDTFIKEDMVELANGLWYYDENFKNHPECKKELEIFLQRKAH